MGTNDRDGKFTGGSLIDGLKRKLPKLDYVGGRVEPKDPPVIQAEKTFKDDDYVFGDDDYVIEPPSLPHPGRGRPRAMSRVFQPPERTEPTMLGFDFDAKQGLWIGEACRPFKPKGLFIVPGTLPYNANVDHIYIGTNMCVMLSHIGVPAHFFTTAKSYEQIAKEIEAGGQPLPAWGEYPIAYPGVRIHIKVSAKDPMAYGGVRNFGPEAINLGMWGLMIP